jgi:hypothetical protein
MMAHKGDYMKHRFVAIATTLLVLLVEADAQNYAKLPMNFEATEAEASRLTTFQSRAAGYAVSIAPDRTVLALAGLQHPSARSSKTIPGLPKAQPFPPMNRPIIVGMRLVGANARATMAGLNELEAKSNYYLGSDPAKWRTGISRYEKVQCKDIYPGIDVVYYGNRVQLEFDFVISPGASPEILRLTFEGTESIRVDENGDLVLHTSDREIKLQAPTTYQVRDGQRHAIPARYGITGENEVSLQVAAYDKSSALVVDPVLSYSTYLGGSDFDFGGNIAADNAGNAYVTGYTVSTDFPVKGHSLLNSNQGGADSYVSKFSPNGTLLYSTYLGGNGDDFGLGITTDSLGNIYVTGQTYSTNFPVKNALQSSAGGGSDAFVTKLSRTGELVYSTYLGGSSDDIGTFITVDPAGNAYLTGQTYSTNFATKNAPQPANAGGSDAFITKLNPSGSELVYSTYLGGSGNDDEAYGIAIDQFRNAYVAGYTNSGDFPTKNALQPYPAGGYDAFVTKLNSYGSALIYSTYLGGSDDENGLEIAVDHLGNAYLTGSTCSNDFPVMNAAQAQLGGICDAFVTKLNSKRSALLYSTYLGGSDFDFARGIGIQDLPSGASAYVSGLTCSTDFPVVNAIQATPGGNCDAFVDKLSPSGASSAYSTYLGGSDFDMSHGVAVDLRGNAYVAGFTCSTDFPTVKAFQAIAGGNCDAFVTKIALK